MLPPRWKVRREMARIGGQLRELPHDIVNYLVATQRYDRSRAKEIRRYPGNLPGGTRVAIFLIFPDNGLQASHLRTLDYFHDKGYSAFVVSNVPLSDQDREALLCKCWFYMERPNFGYDFGGYRDGVLEIEGQLASLERLVLINDSTWFPLPDASDWLDDVEALDVDFAGAASNYGTPRSEIEDFLSMKWDYRSSHRNFHYCSFALCLRPAILRHPDFLTFWRRLRLSDKKKRTVRRGEIGFTQWALGRHFSHGATLEVGSLDRDLDALDDTQLIAIARLLVIPEHRRLQQFWRDMLAQPTQTRPDLIKLILLSVTLQGSSYALAPYAIWQRNYPFLKKSPIWLSRQSCSNTLQLLDGIDGAEDLLAEARELSARRPFLT